MIPSSCTLSVRFSFTLHPINSQFLLLTFVVWITQLLTPCPVFRWCGSANSLLRRTWNRLLFPPRHRPFGWSPSISAVSSHRPLYPPRLPSQTLQIYYLCYSRQWNPLPASEVQLRYFASWLADQVSFPTIKLYLAGIRFTHIENSLVDPFADAPLLHLLLRGIKRTKGLSSRRRLPITMSVMRQLKEALATDPRITSRDKLMLWSAFTLAFFAFLRSSEFTSPSSTRFNSRVHLCFSDISFTTTGSLSLQLKTSKTDPFRKGCLITVAPSGRSVCAVRAIRRYLDHQPPRSASPLYFFSTGQFLTRNKVTSILRLQLHRLGFATESYASHSFRIGAATTAAEAGLPPWLIQTLGRWSSTCYTQYIRTPASILHAVPSRLAATCNMPLQSWDPTTGQCTPF